MVPVQKVHEVKQGSWGYQVIGVGEKKVNLKVCSAADAIVGKYQLFVDTVHSVHGDQRKFRYCHPDDIFVLFNPWCAGQLIKSRATGV